jgi:hypothetical protein
MRRSSLYLALVRFVTFRSPICFVQVPGTAPPGQLPDAITASPDVRDQLRAAHLGAEAAKVKFCRDF